MKLLTDIGSTHRGSLDAVRSYLHVAADLGIGVKLQLIPAARLGQNAMTPYGWMFKLADLAHKLRVPFSASVWDLPCLSILEAIGAPFVKIARSACQDHALIDEALKLDTEVIVSYGGLDITHGGVTRLYCPGQSGADYPLDYTPNFESLFEHYEGFSDHTRGIRAAILAGEAGAQVIEKHVRLYDDGTVQYPDEAFALPIKSLQELVSHASRSGIYTEYRHG